jgi:hypothetical protein
VDERLNSVEGRSSTEIKGVAVQPRNEGCERGFAGGKGEVLYIFNVFCRNSN